MRLTYVINEFPQDSMLAHKSKEPYVHEPLADLTSSDTETHNHSTQRTQPSGTQKQRGAVTISSDSQFFLTQKQRRQAATQN